MKRHELKTHPTPFSAVLRKEKLYELRFNDRDFQAGDALWLREWDPETKSYTGRSIDVEVGHMTRGGEWGLPPNLCVLGLKPETMSW